MIYSLIRNFQLEMANIFVYKSVILCIQGVLIARVDVKLPYDASSAIATPHYI
jgi:hypothetical protein